MTDMTEVVLQAGVSRVEISADHIGFTVTVDPQPHIVYGLIEHVAELRAESRRR